MAIPTKNDLYLPTLTEMSKENREFSPREIADMLKPKFGITASDMNATREDGYQSYYENGHWALYDLKRAGLIEHPSHGRYILTDEGRLLLANPPKLFNKAFIDKLERQKASKVPTS